MQLAFRYNKGEGLPKDNVRAYKWFYIAEKGGDQIAGRALPLLAREMADSQIEDATSMAGVTMQKLVVNTGLLCELYQQFCGE